MSTYSIDYVPSKVYSKLPPITPKENGIIYSTDDCMQSSYNEEYSPKEAANRAISFKPKNHYEKSTEAFESQSNYKNDFIHNQIPKQKSLKPIVKYLLPTEAFSTDTNYQSEFTEKSVEKCTSTKPIDCYQFSKSHDESLMSNYQEDFIHIKGEKSRSCRPKNLYTPTVQNELWTSNYQTDFMKHSLTDKFVDGPLDKISKSSQFLLADPANFPDQSNAYSTNYNDNFIKSKDKIEKMRSFKPESDFKLPDEIFNSSSSYTMDFERFKVKPSKSFKPINTYHPPDEPITSRSSYDEEFMTTKRPIKVLPIKPVNQITLAKDKTDFVTDYSKEFHTNPNRLAGKRSDEFRPSPNYELSSEPFSGISNYMDDFVKSSRNEKVKPMERKDELNISNDKMEFMTTSKEDFDKKIRQIHDSKTPLSMNPI